MALTTRGGNKADFDSNKMVPKEIAGTFDTKEIFYAFGPGDVKQLATKEDFQADLDAINDNIERAETAIAVAESLAINKAGINDTTPTLTEAYSGAKTQELIDDITIADLSNKPVTFTQATTDTDIATGDTLAILFGKILKRFATITTSLASKFNKADIIQNDTTNDSTKVPSSAVTFALGAEIDTNKTAITAINNILNGDLLAKGNASANANIYITNGVRMWYLPDTATSFNYPVQYGILCTFSSGVSSAAYVAQIAISLVITNTNTYRRTSSNGGTTWSAWTVI